MATGDTLDDVHRHISDAMLALALHLDGKADPAAVGRLADVARSLSAAQQTLSAVGRAAVDAAARRMVG